MREQKHLYGLDNILVQKTDEEVEQKVCSCFIDIFLEVQNKRYSQILYLIDYIAYGLHSWYIIRMSKEMYQNLKKIRFTNKYPDKAHARGCLDIVGGGEKNDSIDINKISN